MRKLKLTDDNIYHIYNRGVEKRDIFLSFDDYYRFTYSLFQFNDDSPATNLLYHLRGNEQEIAYRKLRYGPLVEILAFCLMPNHFHLMLRQRKPNGITRFMHKMGTGYTMYFNQKYKHSGVLFQGTFRAVHIKEECHFTYLPFYIHMNPIKLYRGYASIEKMVQFIEEYRWSSFPDYIGRENFPLVTSREFLSDYMGKSEACRLQMKALLQDKIIFIETIKDIALESIEATPR